MAMTKLDWTEPMLAKLRTMLAEEKSAESIAYEFGMVSKSAAIGHVHRLLESGKLEKGFKKRTPPVRKPNSKATGVTSKRIVRGQGNKPERVVFHELKLPEELEKFNASRPGTKLLKLKSDGCRWPVKGAGPNYLFCNAKTHDDNYCPFHASWRGAPYRRKAS